MEATSYYDLTYKYTYFMSHHTPLNNPDPDENLSSYFGRNSAFFKHYNPAIWDKIDAQAAELDPRKAHRDCARCLQGHRLGLPVEVHVHHELPRVRQRPEIQNWFWEQDLYRNTIEGLWFDV